MEREPAWHIGGSCWGAVRALFRVEKVFNCGLPGWHEVADELEAGDPVADRADGTDRWMLEACRQRLKPSGPDHGVRI
jgi:hypothetical protein